MPQFETEKTILDSKTIEHDVSAALVQIIQSDSLRSLFRVLFGLLVSYFLVTAGVIYDIIVEPPSVGQLIAIAPDQNILLASLYSR